MSFVVYGLEDPRDHLYHYIGITDDVYKRFNQHLNGDGGNVKKNGWVFECRQVNLMIIMREIERTETRAEAEEREKFWIWYYLQSGHPLHNTASAKSLLEEKADLVRQYRRLLLAKNGLIKQIRLQEEENLGLASGIYSLPTIPTEQILTLHNQGLSLRAIVKVTGAKYSQVQKVTSRNQSETVEEYVSPVAE